MKSIKLTDVLLRRAKARSEELTDASSVGLIFRPTQRQGAVGVGAWYLRYTCPLTGNRQKLVIGRYPAMGLSAARAEASHYREMVDSGKNPQHERDKALRQQQKDEQCILKNVVDEYLSEKSMIWKGGESGSNYKRWKIQFDKYVLPKLGNRAITSISHYELAETLHKVWIETSETGNKLVQNLGALWAFAEAREYVPNKNIVDKAKQLLPAKKRRDSHYPSQPYQDIPALVQAILTKNGGSFSQCSNSELLLFFTIINASRGSASRLLRWEDVDFQQGIWVLRAKKERTKVKQDGFYPLTKKQIEILLEMEKRKIEADPSIVFPSRSHNKNGWYLSDNTLNKLLKYHKVKSDIDGKYAVAHGYRSSFMAFVLENRDKIKDDEGNQIYIDREVIEKQLQHTQKNRTIQAYDRSKNLKARKIIVEYWEKYIFGL